ncbi:GCN5-related N-acetyltransferase [Proteiniborus sp. DW1]|uniref:GNAT family N-acetyltransferase n=1 Tax=Proteiniborus sp. DW1 TaxID=1889883 RepID=UPI00092E1387|nr:GNAT family N-acetyltransferase [Proteiniborus sp. DW1]SCG84475.1 GCN5-related N-acetyltransferase [Proteiniborus sp. DW1]
MCEVRGNRVKVRLLTYEDVLEMRNWGKHDDPLFKDYNFPNFSDDEVRSWFNYRTSRKNTRCFSVLDEEDRMIGYINIRNIKKIMRAARLGIVFNPDVLNRGYGSDALMAVLGYYFDVMKMNTLYLDVAKFNKRAIRCYEKCGFKITREYQSKHSNLMEQAYDEKSHVWNEEYFTIKNNIVYCKYYEMKVQKR